MKAKLGCISDKCACLSENELNLNLFNKTRNFWYFERVLLPRKVSKKFAKVQKSYWTIFHENVRFNCWHNCYNQNSDWSQGSTSSFIAGRTGSIHLIVLSVTIHMMIQNPVTVNLQGLSPSKNCNYAKYGYKNRMLNHNCWVQAAF